MYKEGCVTVDNFIAEMIFKRRAEFNKEALPQSFWNNPKYKGTYLKEIIGINRLLERMCSSCIIKAFNKTKACSITNPALVSLAEQYQKEMGDINKIVTKTEEKAVQTPQKPFGKVNRLSEL
jgi:hypothetical protein